MTLGSVLLFTYLSSVRQYAVDNIWILFAALVVVFVTMFTLLCCQNVRYSWPYNLIVLFIFTSALSYLVGFITLRARPELVIENQYEVTKEYIVNFKYLSSVAGAASRRPNHTCRCRPYDFRYPNQMGFYSVRRSAVYCRPTLRYCFGDFPFHGIR